MTIKTLLAKLAEGEIVALTPATWDKLASLFEVRQRKATGLAGELLIVKNGKQLAAVEEADAKTRAVRPLASLKAADLFVKERMAVYDRMWDG